MGKKDGHGLDRAGCVRASGQQFCASKGNSEYIMQLCSVNVSYFKVI